MHNFSYIVTRTREEMGEYVEKKISEGKWDIIGATIWDDDEQVYYQSIIRKTSDTKEDSQNDTQQTKATIAILSELYNDWDELSIPNRYDMVKDAIDTLQQ